jgi:YHS domain-containing protein
VAEVTAAAGKYASKAGAFDKAVAAAPIQSQLNSAYAGLKVPQSAPLAVPPQQQHVAASANVASSPIAQQNNPFAGQKDRIALATPAVPAAQSTAPQVVNNPTANAAAQASQAPIAVAPPAPAPIPKQVNNPYSVLTAATPPVQQQPVSPLISPDQTTPVGYDKPASRSLALAAANVPPAPPAAAAAPSRQVFPNTVPDPRLLPPGAPPLAFDGYCPVSMRNSWKWIAGDPRFGVVHRGHTYWFATAEEQKQFWTDPDRYTPALSGMDPVLAIDHQQQVPGKREHSLDYDGIFYMFASEATLQQFTANPQRYSTGVRQAMGIPRGRLVR